LPWGLEGAVYLLITCPFAIAHSLIGGRQCFLLGGQGMLLSAIYSC
jgi:hypothetical protein